MSARAMVILAHGSRSSRAVSSFLELIRHIRQDSGRKDIYGAFFSLGQPGLEQVVEQLARSQTQKIVVFPYFLLDGSHVQKDIPTMIGDLEKKYPEIEFQLLDSLEHEPLMYRILQQKVEQFL